MAIVVASWLIYPELAWELSQRAPGPWLGWVTR